MGSIIGQKSHINPDTSGIFGRVSGPRRASEGHLAVRSTMPYALSVSLEHKSIFVLETKSST